MTKGASRQLHPTLQPPRLNRRSEMDDESRELLDAFIKLTVRAMVRDRGGDEAECEARLREMLANQELAIEIDPDRGMRLRVVGAIGHEDTETIQ